MTCGFAPFYRQIGHEQTHEKECYIYHIPAKAGHDCDPGEEHSPSHRQFATPSTEDEKNHAPPKLDGDRPHLVQIHGAELPRVIPTLNIGERAAGEERVQAPVADLQIE